MSREHGRLRSRLGGVGVWTFAFDSRRAAQIAEDVAAIEALGYPALWVPEGGRSRDVIGLLSWLATNSDRLTVASGIATTSARDPEVLQAGATLLADAFGERIVLGIGVGHETTHRRRGLEWARPVARMEAYLEAMDRAAGAWPSPAVPAPRLLAALGDSMLRLSATRALGAHTYFVPPEHTARARGVLGPEAVLAVEQTVVLASEAAQARAIARAWAADYLELPNYANNWRRLGYTEEDVAGGGSDRLIDAGIVVGSTSDVAERIRAHRDAGADHVCVQVISGDDADTCLPQLTELASVVLAEG